MRLEKIKLKNFRSFKEETVVDLNNITAFVGRNDVGKSTILEALDIFFNDSKNATVTGDIEDKNIYTEDDYYSIACVFSDLPEKVLIDVNVTTTLGDEYLLNDEGKLEIVKQYNCSSSKPKEAIFFVCMHPTNNYTKDLLQLKNSDLKNRAKELQIDENLYDAKVNSQLRRVIREAVGDLNVQTTFLEADKNDCKPIYEDIKKYLPIYALFQSDRTSNDNDREVVDPMKLAISQALQNVQGEIDKIKQSVMDEAMEIVEGTLKKLNEMSPEIAKHLQPEFLSEPKLDSAFKIRMKSDDNIPMNKRGSGVRRLLLLNFFRAEAERRMNATNHNSVIYAFEEPETSQHPDYQEMLITSLIELSQHEGVQVLLTTHTPGLAGLIPTESIRLLKRNEKNETIVCLDSDEVLAEVCDEIGVLPIPLEKNIKAVLFVEGPSDVVFIEHISNELYQNNIITSSLKDAGFIIIPIGGCGNLKHWRNKKIIEQFGLPWCIMVDSDRGATRPTENVKRINELRSQSIKAYATRKREAENYIAPECINSKIKYSDTDDAKKIISQETGINDSDVLEHFWPKMTFEQIRLSEKYIDNDGKEHFEFTEMLTDFLSLI